MRFNREANYGTHDHRDYKDRVVVAVYNRDMLDWLVLQQNSDIEIYGNPVRTVQGVTLVGVPERLYTMMALKW